MGHIISKNEIKRASYNYRRLLSNYEAVDIVLIGIWALVCLYYLNAVAGL